MAASSRPPADMCPRQRLFGHFALSALVSDDIVGAIDLKQFPELMAAAEKSFSNIIRSGTHRAEMAVPELLAGATLLKAARFNDEREVRIAVVPGTDVFRRAAKKEHAEFPDMPLPVIRPRPDKSGRWYIAIFDGVGVTLPIKRVIVGPSEHQAEYADLARSPVGADRVVLSALSIVPSAVPAG